MGMIGAMNERVRELEYDAGVRDVIRRWPEGKRLLAMCSGRFEERWANRCIFTTANEAWTFIEQEDGGADNVWVNEAGEKLSLAGCGDDPFIGLKRVLGEEENEGCLWAGYLGYEMGRWVEDLPRIAKRDRGWPVGVMHRCEGWLVYSMDSKGGCWKACGDWAEQLPSWVIEVLEGTGDEDEEVLGYGVGRFVGEVEREVHEGNVQKTLDYIAAGDVFEANITQRFSAAYEGGKMGARGLFLDMLEASPSWYAGYMECMEVDKSKRVLVSISPELFLEVGGGGEVVTRPIKGTRPGWVDPQELLDSVKDWAELNMVVDMMRNDLGRVCEYGSMEVVEGRVIESHPTVHHGVATIKGRLRGDEGLVDLLRATLPGGSITGAPKVRAMEIIEELEAVRRGPYTGGMGWICGEEMGLNIAIRTAMIEMGDDGKGVLDYAVGGGIVADSVPREEYEESLDKMAAIMKAVEKGNYHTHR